MCFLFINTDLNYFLAFFPFANFFSPLCLYSKSFKDNLSCIIKALIYLVAKCIPGSQNVKASVLPSKSVMT